MTNQTEPLTLQSFFDTMIEGLERQQYRAAYADNSCVYVHSNGTGCAIGVVLDDTEKAWLQQTQDGFYNRKSFRKVIEVSRGGSVFVRWRELASKNIEVLAQAQTNHDTHLRDGKIAYWFVATLELMHACKLNTDQLVAAMDRYVEEFGEHVHTNMFYRKNAEHKMHNN